MPYNVIQTRPAGYPVTAAQVKDEIGLRSANTAHDTKLARHIKAATEWVEQHSRRNLVQRVWDSYFDRFPSNNGPIMLPKAPLISVEHIKYTDVTQSPELVTVATSVYTFEPTEDAGVVYLQYNQSWPAASKVRNAVTVRFTSGYASSGSPEELAPYMPEDLRQAIIMIAIDLFENPQAQTDMQLYENKAVKAMIAPHKLREL